MQDKKILIIDQMANIKFFEYNYRNKNLHECEELRLIEDARSVLSNYEERPEYIVLTAEYAYIGN